MTAKLKTAIEKPSGVPDAKCQMCLLRSRCMTQSRSTQLLYLRKSPEVLILIGDSLPPGFNTQIQSLTPEDINLYKGRPPEDYANFKFEHRLSAYGRSKYNKILHKYVRTLQTLGVKTIEVLCTYDYQAYGFEIEDSKEALSKQDISNMQLVPITSLKHCSSDLVTKINLIDPKLIVFAGETKHMSTLSSDIGALQKAANKLESMQIGDKTYPVLPTPGFTSYLKKDANKIMLIESATVVSELLRRGSIMGEYIQLASKKIQVGKDLNSIHSILKQIHNRGYRSPVAIDIETNTANPTGIPGKQRIISIAFAWESAPSETLDEFMANLKCGVFLLDHKACPYKKDRAKIIGMLKKILEDPRNSFIAHNAKFELQWLRDLYNFEKFSIADDTMVMAYMLQEDLKGFYNLKTLTGTFAPVFSNYEKKMFGELENQLTKSTMCEEAFGPCNASILHKCDKMKSLPRPCVREREGLEDIIKQGKKNLNFEKVNPKVLQIYNGMDTIVTLYLAKQLSKKMLEDITEEKKYRPLYKPEQNKTLIDCYSTYMMPGIATLSKMQFHGILVDQNYLGYLEKEFKVKLNESVDVLRTYIPKAGVENLEKDTGLEILKKFLEQNRITPTLNTSGKLALNVAARANYLSQARMLGEAGTGPVHVVMKYYEDYKTYLKGSEMLQSHYISKIGTDGRIHPSFNPTGTATGRLSSSNPNFQNLPKMVGEYNFKKALIPDPGHVIVNADYSAAEIRVLAWYCKDPNLIKLVKDGLDMHSYIGATVAGIDYEEFKYNAKTLELPEFVTLRSNAKATVFALVYGGSAYSIANNINQQAGTTVVTEDEIQGIVDNFFQLFPGAQNYMTKIAQYAIDHRFIKTKTGRKRRFMDPLTTGSKYKAEARIRRQAMNSPIQGTSSDLVVGQLIEIANNIHQLEGQVLLTVHDSITAQVAESKIDQVKTFFNYWMVTRINERYPDFPVPFAIDVEIGPNYGETKKI